MIASNLALAASRKTRVAIVVSHPIQHFVHFYRGLAKAHGIELRVFYCSSIGAKQYFDKDMGVAIQWQTDLLSGYDHVFLPEADSITRTTFWKVNNPSITKALDDFKPDIVKIHGYAQATLIRTLLWCGRRNIPAMIWSDSELLHSRSPVKKALKHLILRVIYGRISGFLSVGDNNEAYFRHYGVRKNQIFRVPFTIDEEAFAAARDNRGRHRTEWRTKLGIPQNAFAVLCVGKLIERKRPGDLIEALKIICSRKSGDVPLAILFAGDGPLRKELEAAAATVKDKCFFLGFVNVDKLPEIYAAVDALAHVSDMDPHPLTTSEASFVGLPLILSDRIGAVGPTDTARPGVNALVYPCCHTGRLADAIQRLMDEPELREKMGKASLQIANELNLQASVSGFLSAVDTLAPRKPASPAPHSNGGRSGERIAYFLTHPIQYQSPLIRRLVNGGMNLHVFYSTDNTSRSYYDPGFSREVAWDVPLLDGYPHTILNKEEPRGLRPLLIRSFERQIREALDSQPADMVWLHGWHHPFVVAAWNVARDLGLPIMLRGETSRGSIRGGRIMRLAHWLYYGRRFRDVSAFLALGSLNRSLYLRYGIDERKIFLVPHAVDNQFFQERARQAHASREALRKKLGLPAGELVILYSGRLAKEKDVGTLIKAVGCLNRDGSVRCRLAITGDGPLKPKLEALAAKSAPGAVNFLGFLNQTELPAIYDLADIFVMPSLFEPWGLVVNEVMNAGKPVIVSDRVGGGPDLVRPGENGDVFRAGDLEDLRAKLRPWLNDESLRQKGGVRSMEIISNWSFEEDLRGMQAATASIHGIKAA